MRSNIVPNVLGVKPVFTLVRHLCQAFLQQNVRHIYTIVPQKSTRNLHKNYVISHYRMSGGRFLLPWFTRLRLKTLALYLVRASTESRRTGYDKAPYTRLRSSVR